MSAGFVSSETSLLGLYVHGYLLPVSSRGLSSVYVCVLTSSFPNTSQVGQIRAQAYDVILI